MTAPGRYMSLTNTIRAPSPRSLAMRSAICGTGRVAAFSSSISAAMSAAGSSPQCVAPPHCP